MFDIISIGRSDLLIAVLQGLAILTADDGPAGFGGLVALGLLVGVALTVARGIVTQRLDLQWIFVGWAMYAVLFLPKVTVTVEDIYTGDTTAVANVPIGVAAIGGVTSTIGLTLTEAFGTAFAFPSMTETGYLDALEIVSAIREMDYGDANDLTASGNLKHVDLQRSLRAYLTDCVVYDMLANVPNPDVTWEEVRTAADLLAAIEVDSNAWYTTVWLLEADADGQTVTCTEAYRSISTNMTANFLPAWTEYIGTVLGLDDPASRIQDAVDALFGVGRSAQDFMLNSLIARELRLAELGYHAAANNTPGVVMRTQAMEQRRTQWASEQSMFLEVARPLISYIEAFFYAVSPFMAFLFTLGAVGISLFARYLLLAIWVQLWLPVMAINNLYINIAASERLRSIDAGGMDILSLAGLESVWTETTSWLAVGGLLAAATPLLTLMILTGSYYAFTRLTDRMAGGDHIDERIATPATLQPAPVAAAGALGLHSELNHASPTTGLVKKDAERILPSISIGSGISEAVEGARTAQQQAVAEWASAHSTGLSLNRTEHIEQFARNLTSESNTATRTTVDQVMEQMARSVVQNDALFRSMTSEERGLLQGAIGASLGRHGNGAGSSGTVQAVLQNIESLSESQREQIADNISNLAQSQRGLMGQLAEAIAVNAEEGQASRYTSALGVADSTDWRQAQRDVATSAESLRSLTAFRNHVGSDFKMDAPRFGHQAVADDSVAELMRLATENSVNIGYAQDLARNWTETGVFHDHDQALAAALGVGLSQGDALSRAALAEYMAPRFGTLDLELESPQSELELAGSEREFGNVRSQVSDAVIEVPSGPESVRAEVEDSFGSFEANRETGRSAVEHFFEASSASNAESMERALNEIDRIAVETRAEYLEENFDANRGVFKALSDLNVSEQVASAFDGVGTSIGVAASGYVQSYREAREQGANVASAAWSGIGGFLRGYGEGFDASIQQQYNAARQHALDRGFPKVVADYYANQNIMFQQSIDSAVLQGLGLDHEWNRQVNEAREVLGDAGLSYVYRAARADEHRRKEYLDNAMDLYSRKQEVASVRNE